MFLAPLFCIFALFPWLGRVCGFDLVVSSPTQCGMARFTWIGGTPPFRALIIPPGGSITNVSIPVNSWNDKDQSGDFSTIIPLPAGASVMFSMSDATGVTAGGATSLMTIGQPTDGSPKCNTSDPGTDFTFNLDGMLSQCKPYPFTGYTATGAIQPVTILVAVPHGESFLLHPPVGDTFNWIANITASTSVTFSMMDAQNRIGGSVIKTVGSSDDPSCIRPIPSNVPSTSISTSSSIPPTSVSTSASIPPTSILPSSSVPQKPMTTSPSPPTNIHGNGSSGDSNGNQKSDKTGAIIGASVGSAMALLIIAALVYCKGRRKIDANHNGLIEPGPDSSAYLLDSQQQEQRTYPYPLYQDGTVPQVGLAGTPPTGAIYNTFLNDPVGFGSKGTGSPVPGVPMGVVAPMWANQPWDPAMVHQQYSPQQDYDPYEMGPGSPVAGVPSAAYPSLPGRLVSRSVSDSQFGVGSASDYSPSAGPGTTSILQSSKRLSPVILSSQRFIVHTDIEDEPIELPPVYSEYRGPVTGMR